MKSVLRSCVPGPVWDACRRFAYYPDWWLTAAGRVSARRLAQFRNLHAGKRCFILGNGPSLARTDLSRLRNEITFGLNRFYLAFPDLGFATTYLVGVNKVVLEQVGKEFSRQPSFKFVSWSARDSVPLTEDMAFLRTRGVARFHEDASGEIWEGATVTTVALQIAYYMGFSEVVLIGVDHNFVTQGEPHKLVVSEAGDPNHFRADYFGRGFRWQLPDLETSEIGYRMAREAFAAAGRRIVDATVDGKLDIFPKVAYDTLFTQTRGEP